MDKREEVLAEARTFLGTPYHDGGLLKGIGVDCATFVYLVYFNCGIFPKQEIGVFSRDWFANTTEEKYLKRLMRHATKFAMGIGAEMRVARPGDIALTKTRVQRSRVFNHGGIVTKWPKALHAVRSGVQECNLLQHPLWASQQIVILDPFNGGESC